MKIKGLEYSIIVIFNCLGASLLISSADLISMYISIEFQSFSVYILSSLNTKSESSTSAGLKYFLLGGLSSCIILLGIVIIYSTTGLSTFEDIFSLNSVSEIASVNLPSSLSTNSILNIKNMEYANTTLANLDEIKNLILLSEANNIKVETPMLLSLTIGLILIFSGFLLKIAAAPFHYWAPDVYDGTPTVITIWIQIMPKLSILTLLVELQTQIINNMVISNTEFYTLITGQIWHISSNNLMNLLNNSYVNMSVHMNSMNTLEEGLTTLLLITSLCSFFIGTIVGLAQTMLKRLLAYSTISHVGFILLSLSLNTVQSIDSLFLYIVQYSLTTLLIFLILLAISQLFFNYTYIKDGGFSFKFKLNEDIKYIAHLGSLFPFSFISLSLSLAIFSMAGIPPFIGFFGKQFVLYSAISSENYFFSFIAIFVSVISAAYYLKLIKYIYTFKSNFESREIKYDNSDLISLFKAYSISSLSAFIFFFFLESLPLAETTLAQSLSLFSFFSFFFFFLLEFSLNLYIRMEILWCNI